MPSGSRFETDLQAVRAARGLSLAQIQQQTRIPVDVLRRFEDGELIGDATYNEVYLKAFLKSYAKAVGVAPADALAAYEAQQRGGYNGSLHPDHKASAPSSAPASPPQPEPPSAPADALPEAPERVPDPVAAVRERAPKRTAPASPAVPSKRVSRPVVPDAKRSFDKNWGMILGLFVGAVVVLGGLIWLLVFRGSGEPEVEGADPSVAATAQVDSAGVGAGAAASGKRLQIPIRITVTAGEDGLQEFRVTEAPEDRRPYWIESGQSETYESDSLIVLWGEGANGLDGEATLELQGERWSPADGQVLRIDRESGQRLLDSLATAPAPSQPASDGA